MVSAKNLSILFMKNKSPPLSRTPLFIGESHETLYGVLHHEQSNKNSSNTVLVICPPVGIDYMNSHRSLRHLADEVAQMGTPCLRLDYLGTGNSADGLRTDDISKYLNSIVKAYKFIQKDLNVKQIALLGFRFGATLAALASEKLDIKYLILWSGIYQGRSLLREIRLLEKMSSIVENNPENIDAGGWEINKATQDAINNIDINKIVPRTNNVLILSANKSPKHKKLINQWVDNNNKVITLYGVTDIAEMLVDAHDTVVPEQTIHIIKNWIKPSFNDRNFHISPKTSAQLECIDALSNEPFKINESLHFFHNDINQFYVKTTHNQTTEKALPLVILLNSGSNHHVGPHRLYVTISRMLAREGFTCIMLDLPGLGESISPDSETENSCYMANPTEAIQACIDHVAMPSNEVILMGLCSGAYHAFLAAIELESTTIVESILINPDTFYWEQGMVLADSPSQHYHDWVEYLHSIKNRDKWKKLFAGQVKFLPIIALVLQRVETVISTKLNLFKGLIESPIGNQITSNITNSLIKIKNKKVYISIIFARNEPGIKLLMDNAAQTVRKLQQHKELEINYIENADHTFSKSVPRQQLFEYLQSHLLTRYSKPITK